MALFSVLSLESRLVLRHRAPMRKIRHATIRDAAAVREIYSPHVLETAVSFETELPSVTDFEKRIGEVQNKFPWLVGEENGVITGYAYATQFRVRAAYDWSVESTAYVRPGFERMGVGRDLYVMLFELLKAQGVVNVIGAITLPNEGSVGLHERMGFRQVAKLPGVGFKFGKWWDVGYWQLELHRPEKPAPLALPSLGD